MKISICIPQYNRIRFLLQSLEMIASQSYDDIEVVVSDDCSTDDTEARILELQPAYRYPLVYKRNEKNKGYDANYRQCISIASGDYCIVIGNDDSINGKDGIKFLADFLQANDFPEIGFCNFVEASDPTKVIERTTVTGVTGSGLDVALKNYSCFSFVGGLIYKKSAFDKYNTSKHDGSIYAQMYLGIVMIAQGCRLFSIKEPLVIKDIDGDNSARGSYVDTLARKWKDMRVVDGGLPSVTRVLISAVEDVNKYNPDIGYKIIKRIYTVTYPYWIMDYKKNGAFVEAVGLSRGLHPSRNDNLSKINRVQRAKVYLWYNLSTIAAFLTPVGLFNRLKSFLYKQAKKN
jgi:glycosyltransferase involved in cell wall biosynthesis